MNFSNIKAVNPELAFATVPTTIDSLTAVLGLTRERTTQLQREFTELAKAQIGNTSDERGLDTGEAIALASHIAQTPAELAFMCFGMGDKAAKLGPDAYIGDNEIRSEGY